MRQGLVAILKTELLLAHATWIEAESPQPGRLGPGEDLQRKARFFAGGIVLQSPRQKRRPEKTSAAYETCGAVRYGDNHIGET
jgi:hypothetical protein